MLIPDFRITQQECDAFILEDITPAYSPSEPYGYGGPNTLLEDVLKTAVTLDFGGGRVWRLDSTYVQGRPNWIIQANHLPTLSQVYPDCDGCNEVPCSDCQDCDDGQKLEADCAGYLSTFPSGCMTARFEVIANDPTTNNTEYVAGTKVRRYVFYCKEHKMLLDIADKMTLGNEKGPYDFYAPKEKRGKKMQELMFTWTKMKLLSADTANVDCNCIASRIKQINENLKDLK